MDADGNVIEIVEDDMGEGMKDPYDAVLEHEAMLKKLEKLQQRKDSMKEQKK